MGAEQSCQPAACANRCEQLQNQCDGDGDAVDHNDYGNEVVDIGFVDQKKAVEEGRGRKGGQKPFDINLVRVGDHWRTLGLLVSPDDDPRYLIVDDIWEPSLVSQWNQTNSEDKRVHTGDIILSVNRNVCGGERMLAEIQASGKGSTLHLSIAHCNSDDED
mmetsp:Transcript_70518/g.181743  ORF Transcript_70518/g.181743 Transcript_70518/m.181743 type:complete len:161 (+) Transcript_70518:81-563(+)